MLCPWKRTRRSSAVIRQPIIAASYDALDEIVLADVITPNMISSVPRGLEAAKLVHQKTLTGTHTGDFYGIPATGKRINLSAIYLVRIAAGKIVEHWGAENGVTVLRQLGFKIKLEPMEE